MWLSNKFWIFEEKDMLLQENSCKNDAKCDALFWQIFSYKNGEIEKVSFYIFACIFGCKIGTEMYFTSF